MSRRGRHGRPPHLGSTRPTAPAPERASGIVDARPADPRPIAPAETAPYLAPGATTPERPVTFDRGPERAPAAGIDAASGLAPQSSGRGAPSHADNDRSATAAPAPVALADASRRGDGFEAGRAMCTTAQLRRFIKSRPWVPMHELRRRFGIWGADDDVSPLRVGQHTLFIGLPVAESGMMAELLNAGDVGYELSLDPTTPIVVGVYPMRPVPRS